jgi:Ca-activated chloride channel homolog
MFKSWKTLAVVPFLALIGVQHSAYGRQASLDVSLAHPTLLAGAKQTTYLKVGLTGFKILPSETRSPVNVAFVLDRSGSMSGTKLAQAKAAAIHALERLGSNDIVSVVVYDTTVQVVVPATKLTDKDAVRRAIESIEVGSSTALFAGVSKGAAEVRKFRDRKYVNRVILLSDGLANVGPSTPSDLGSLGASLMKEGIAVTTLGLGLDYNEDLMVELSRRSDGNHVFVEEATKLATVFDHEFNDVLSVVAQEITIKIRCSPGIRPVRLLGIDGEINGQEVVVLLNQLYSEQEKYVLLEVEVPGSAAMQTQSVANILVTYANMETKTTDRLGSAISVHFDASPQVVEERTDAKVMAECVLQIANERNAEAVVLRDQGETMKAQALLKSNAAFLNDNAQRFDSKKLEKRALDNTKQSENLNRKDWKRTRKGMRSQQHEDARQQKTQLPQRRN